MATIKQRQWKSKSGRTKISRYSDSSVLSGKQQLKMHKMDTKAATQQSRIKATAIRSASANLGQAIAGATGSIVSGINQSEQTKRAKINAALQATQGGLKSGDDTRDEEDEEKGTTERYPWGIGGR